MAVPTTELTAEPTAELVRTAKLTAKLMAELTAGPTVNSTKTEAVGPIMSSLVLGLGAILFSETLYGNRKYY